MRTLAQLLADFAVESPNGAVALTAWFEDGTIASVITALGFTGQKAAAEASQLMVAAYADFQHILQKEFA